MASERHKPYLPFEIIINILKRLPIKSIVRFQCVCKDWKNLFKTQSFIAEQAHENPLLLIHAYDYECRRSSLRLFNHKMETVEVLRTPSMDSFSRGWRIIGSSNGLLCLQLNADDEDRFPISLCLWNPVSNELREVPEPLYDYTHTCAVGFGFSRVVNDYKIVRFYNENFLRKDAVAGKHNCRDWLDCGQVYSLRTGSWKELEMEHIHTQLFSEATSVDGTIFWFGGTFFYERLVMLVAFDIATEVFTITPMHALSLNVDDLVLLYMLGNKLAMCEGFVFAEPYSFNIWVIEECAGEYENSEAEEEGDQRNFLYRFNLTTKEWKKLPSFSDAYAHCDIFNHEMSLAICLQHIS
ncbi:hypothetical protein QN277_005687 [Acacia crassicarpa]|uniref:F-box domain-containing protein n=1 Tax=Acacia crassicarpa TaxID=499986 RepID=A0AAE1MBG3_9FABA|nr:hypothetical protein QN277_005687 [Acacia crassicarpa]